MIANKYPQKIGNGFFINKYLSVHLENKESIIYINGKRFIQCKYLLLSVPIDQMTDLEDLKSIDEVSDVLDPTLEPIPGREKNKPAIPPEVEYWGHCSNLQVWYENNYNTNLLHSRLAFPLLKSLADAGDPIAKRIFSEEVAKRFDSGYLPVMMFLIVERYLSYLTPNQIDSLEIFNKIKEKALISGIGNYESATRKEQSDILFNGLRVYLDDISPKTANEWIAKAQFYIIFQDFEKVFSIYEQGIKQFPDNEYLVNHYIKELAKVHQYARGIPYIRNRIEKDSENFELWNILGMLYHKSGDLKEAIKSFKKSIQCAPDKTFPRLNLARVYKDQGLIKFSNDILNKLYTMKINDELMLENIAEACHEIGNDKLEAKFARKILFLNPSRSEVWYGLANIYHYMGKHLQERRCFKKVVTLNIDPKIISSALNALGIMYLEQQDNVDKSIECLERAIKEDPNNAMAWSNLCPVYAAKLDTDRTGLVLEIGNKLKEKNYLLEMPENPRLYQITKKIKTLQKRYYSLKYRCPYCKRELKKHTKFCKYCGGKLGLSKGDMKKNY
ncbi:MAG: tetratricopeptide repeat protein [Promethearchaeota archaeon]